MSPTALRSRYLEADVMSRSPHWLVPLMYEHLVAHLRRAAAQIEAGNIEGKAESLTRASRILTELLGSLDFEQGGDVAPKLAALYSFFSGEIVTIGRTLELGRLERVTAMIAELHEAWIQAAEATEARSPGLALAAAG